MSIERREEEDDFSRGGEEDSDSEEKIEFPLEDVLADKKRKYSLEQEYVYLIYNDLVKYFTKKWDGTLLRKTVKNPVDQTSKNNNGENADVQSSEKLPERVEEPVWKFVTPDEQAEIIFSNGNSYTGRVSRMKMEGEGVYRWRYGSQYKGHFEDNKIQGKGFLEWQDSGWYEGDFRDGYRHGKGTMVDKNYKLLYIGDWSHGHKHGKGYCRFEKNDSYDGEWVMDKREGKGVYIYPDGSRYVGQWKNGNRHGRGTMMWPNGDFYRGEWADGKMHGYGEYTWNGFLNKTMSFPQQIRYVGEWQDGMRHGQGTISLNTNGGASYSGEWSQNKKHGKGTIIGNNGELTEGNPLFKNNILLSCQATGKLLDNDEKNIQSEHENLKTELLKKCHKILEPRMTTVLKPEQLIPLVYYINRLQADNSFCRCLGKSDEKTSESECKPENCIALLTKKEYKNSKMESYSEEEYWTYNCITIHMPRIRKIYDFYTKSFCDVAPKCKLSMCKLSMWQLWRDCEIHKKMSLVQIDEYLAANKTTQMENPGKPFSRVEIWQLIHAFLELSWHFYTKYEKNESSGYPGKLANGLDKFLITDIYPNYGTSNSILCRKERELVAVYPAYELYDSIEKSHSLSVRQLLMTIFPAPKFFKHEKPTRFLSIKFLNPNFTCSNSTSSERLNFFLKSENSVTNSNEDTVDSDEPIVILRKLGIKEFVDVVNSVCPLLKDSETDTIINLDYKLTFLEFLEILVKACELLATKKISDTEENSKKEESEERISAVLSTNDEEMTRASARPSLEKKISRGRKKVSAKR